MPKTQQGGQGGRARGGGVRNMFSKQLVGCLAILKIAKERLLLEAK